MNEEAVADSAVEEHSGEPQGGDVFDMEGAVDTLSEGLFGTEKTEEIDEEVDLSQETDDKPAEIDAKDEKPDEKVDEPDDVEKALKEELKREAPKSWKKEMREFFNSADPMMQEYILQRESQMADGLEKDRGDANLGRTMRDVLMPHEATFRERGIEPQQAVRYLLDAHNALSTGTIEQRQANIQKLAQSYGIVNPEDGANPQLQSLIQEVQALKQNQAASEQRTLQERQSSIETEVTAFASDHPLFHDLEQDIVVYINAGYELEDAYDKALWANPLTRQKEMDRLEQEKASEAEKLAKKEAEDAKKASSVNVKGRDSKKAPTAPKGSMEDTMRETYRKINSRN